MAVGNCFATGTCTTPSTDGGLLKIDINLNDPGDGDNQTDLVCAAVGGGTYSSTLRSAIMLDTGRTGFTQSWSGVKFPSDNNGPNGMVGTNTVSNPPVHLHNNSPLRGLARFHIMIRFDWLAGPGLNGWASHTATGCVINLAYRFAEEPVATNSPTWGAWITPSSSVDKTLVYGRGEYSSNLNYSNTWNVAPGHHYYIQGATFTKIHPSATSGDSNAKAELNTLSMATDADLFSMRRV